MVGTRERSTRSRTALAIAIAVALAPWQAGCQRKPHPLVLPPDSTQVAGMDSADVEIRDTQRLWESGGDFQQAADATARLLARAMWGRDFSGWRDRAGYMLDSLGVGAEFADAPCALAVNFFARSDPEAGSWPYLYTCADGGAVYQALEGKNLHLQAIIARGLEPSSTDSLRLVSAVLVRRAAAGPQPIVMTWAQSADGGRWRLIQTLGADSLGGFGTAEFGAVSDTDAELATRAYRVPPGFVECMTCPHVYTTALFRWSSQGFERAETKHLPSPYATFAEFVRMLVAGDRVGASELVSDASLVFAAQNLEWHVSKGPWRPAPGAEESPLSMTFYRGAKEAYAVHFRPQGQDWVITGFEPVTRAVE